MPTPAPPPLTPPPTTLGPLTGLGLAPSACDAVDVEDAGPITFRPGGGFGCTWCGGTLGNSPRVNNASLADINLDGANSSGIKLRGLGTAKFGTIALEVDVATERFVGLAGVDPVLTDDAVLGAKIVLEMPGGTTVHLTISDYDDAVESWAVDHAPMTAYRATYVGGSGQIEPLCPSTSPENQWFTLIAGETYDRVTHTVVADPRTVSLACVGEAAAKMKLMGYGPHGNRGAGPEEREATLRMITADYCGDGTSFTASGVAVAWRDAAGTVLPPTAEKTMEALWNEHGAICLGTPRHAALSDVLDRCPIPACDEPTDDVPDGAVWRTMLPR